MLLVDTSEEHVGRTLDAIESHGGTASIFIGDVTSAESCQAMVEAAVQRYGRLDILHNNVGIGGSGSVVEVDPDDWDRVMEVNVKSMMLMSKYAVPVMASTGGGAIVNISSISAIRPRGLTSYTVSKGGVIALTQAMAVDHAKDGIRVNCILPGPVYSSMVAPEHVGRASRYTARVIAAGDRGQPVGHWLGGGSISPATRPSGSPG